MNDDLDQSGHPEQNLDVYLGPSLGWVKTRVVPEQDIVTGGTFTLGPGSGVVLVNSPTSVVINLPDVGTWLNQTAYMPATAFARAILIKDLGGFAGVAMISVIPFGTQEIDSNPGPFVLSQPNQVLQLLPLKDLSGWYATSQIGASGGVAMPGGPNQSIQFNNNGIFAGFIMGGDASITVGTGILTIGNGVVSYAKMQNENPGTMLGRAAGAGVGVVTELTGVQVGSIIGGGFGAWKAVFYTDGSSSLQALPAGAAGTVLMGTGGAAPPAFTPFATQAQYVNDTPQLPLSTDQVWGAATPVTLANATTVSPNFSSGIDFIWTVGQAGSTLANPTAVKLGQKGLIYLGNGTGTAGVTVWGSMYKFSGGVKPTMTQTINAVDAISYTVKSATEVECFFTGNMS